MYMWSFGHDAQMGDTAGLLMSAFQGWTAGDESVQQASHGPSLSFKRSPSFKPLHIAAVWHETTSVAALFVDQSD